MNTKYPLRHTVRIILLNDYNDLLLMCIDDPKTKSIGGKYLGRFWIMIGGQVDEGESFKEAAIRELFEETGIIREEVELGPIVWFRELDWIANDKPIHLKEKFIVAKTKKKTVALTKLTEYESEVIKHLSWFSLGQIMSSKETIYPTLLSKHLPDIIANRYPKKLIKLS